VLGATGAGKTTAISLLLGLQQADAGSVRLFGMPPSMIDARRQIGVMMQDVYLAPELRVSEQIDLVASYFADPMTSTAAMAVTQTTPLARRPYGKLSGGQKRQVQFAMAICGRPKLLFLDEPTVGLDLESRALMWRTLRVLVDGGASIALTTHYLEEAEALADRVVVLSRGRLIASGTVGELRAFVASRQVICTCALDLDLIRSWPGVDSASREGNRVHIATVDAEAVVRRLLAADTSVTGLEVRRPGLADAFMALTKKAR
jgi:ABC-2 type transport system ATP-binding protein